MTAIRRFRIAVFAFVGLPSSPDPRVARLAQALYRRRPSPITSRRSSCFSEAQPVPPDGFLTVTVKLDGKGGTTNVHLRNTVLNSPKVESGVVARLERLHFDPPLDSKVAVFAYPFMRVP